MASCTKKIGCRIVPDLCVSPLGVHATKSIAIVCRRRLKMDRTSDKQTILKLPCTALPYFCIKDFQTNTFMLLFIYLFIYLILYFFWAVMDMSWTLLFLSCKNCKDLLIQLYLFICFLLFIIQLLIYCGAAIYLFTLLCLRSCKKYKGQS